MEEKEVVSAEKSRKGLRVASIVLLVLGIVLCWVPVVGLICCVLSLVFIAKAKKKGQVKKKVLYILHIVASVVILLFALVLTFNPLRSVNSVIEENAEEYAIRRICTKFGGTVSGSPELTTKKTGEDTYQVAGEMLITKIDYSAGQENTYKVVVDCDINCKNDGNREYTISRNDSIIQDAPVETKPLPEAITKIDTQKATEEAEKVFHEKVQLKNENSYVLNDSTVTASYTKTGKIEVSVLLDYSAQNGLGGMNRNTYRVEFSFYDGEFHYRSATPVSGK